MVSYLHHYGDPYGGPIMGLRLVGRFLPGEKTPHGDLSGKGMGIAPHPHYGILQMPYIDIPNVSVTMETYIEPEYASFHSDAYATVAPMLQTSVKYTISPEWAYKSKHLMTLSEQPPDDYWPYGKPAQFDF